VVEFEIIPFRSEVSKIRLLSFVTIQYGDPGIRKPLSFQWRVKRKQRSPRNRAPAGGNTRFERGEGKTMDEAFLTSWDYPMENDNAPEYRGISSRESMTGSLVFFSIVLLSEHGKGG